MNAVISFRWLMWTSAIGLGLVAIRESAQSVPALPKVNDDTVFRTVRNKNGPTLGYSINSGVRILNMKGLFFKDLNKNGTLDPYEDWRLSVDDRCRDLASKMSVEQIAGLMLYSIHQAIPANPRGFGAGTYNGKPLAESGLQPWDVSDQQKEFLTKDNLRHILITKVQSP